MSTIATIDLSRWRQGGRSAGEIAADVDGGLQRAGFILVRGHGAGGLPPQPHAPEEDLVSLIYFYEANHDAVVTPLEPPIGKVSGLPPVTSAAFIKERLDAITVG